ncbi:MAG: HNH endonuclease [Sedimentisphaerales bacterium]|nr:HNH endonuclease [Sedimentisphaerales bacterium]
MLRSKDVDNELLALILAGMSNNIPDELAADMLARCGRFCCLCRRFRPTYLQVHHITEPSKGGTNAPDNLIAICLTCHSDVHTKRPFTRRFTAEELRQHRDTVLALVADGKLIPPEEDDTVSAHYEGIRLSRFSQEAGIPDLPSEAIDILIAASESRHGRVLMTLTSGGFAIGTGGRNVIQTQEPRDEARYRQAMKVLQETGCLDPCGYKGEVFRITHDGYLLADQLLALRARSAGE